MFKRRNNTQESEQTDYWVSFTDLMSALVIILIFAIIFLLMQRGSSAVEFKRKVAKLLADVNYYQSKNSVVTSVDDIVTCEAQSDEVTGIFERNLAVKIERYSELVAERINTVHRISKLIQVEGLSAQVSNDGHSILIPTDQLSFEQGEFKIPKSKKYLIESIAEVLYFNLVPERKHELYESVEIIGHTDSKPAKGLLFQNWGLSVHRAASFWEAIRSIQPYGKSLSELRNWKGEALFSIAGFGSTRPIIVDDNRDDEQKINRRIEIRFGIKQFNDQEMRAFRVNI